MVERKKGAERQEESRPSPITADVNSRLAAYTTSRSRRRRPPRRGLTWLFILLLIAAVTGLAYWGNQQREGFEMHLNELQGQLSNIQARLDSLDTSNSEDSNPLLTTLSKRVDRLTNTQVELNALQKAFDDSLNALEENGRAARKAMHVQLDSQRQTLEKHNERLQQGKQNQSAQQAVVASLTTAARAREEQLEKQQEVLDELRMQRTQDHDMLETLESTLDERVSRLDEQLKEQGDTLKEQDDALKEQRGTLKELRQIQVALSAQLEMLQGNP